MENKPELGIGEGRLGFIELFAEVASGLVVSGLGEMMQFDGESLCLQVWNQINPGIEDLQQ